MKKLIGIINLAKFQGTKATHKISCICIHYQLKFWEKKLRNLFTVVSNFIKYFEIHLAKR